MRSTARFLCTIVLMLNAAALAAQTEAVALMLNAVSSMSQPEAVDLGLSVKWASCNLGADTPEGFGEYYAWAETSVKERYDKDTYAFAGEGPYGFTKYNAGFKLNYNAEAEDDVVAARLGGCWRMPTFTEMNELVQQCDWALTEQNGVAGYKVTSRTTGASIFLPAAGYMEGGELCYPGTAGRYWTATRHAYHPNCAMNLFFSEEFHYAYFSRRYRGFPIRPVYSE